jgi:hypothetical protein
MPAQVHRIDGVALLVQGGGQPCVATAVFVDAVDHDDRRDRGGLRQPVLLVEFQAVVS